MLHFLTLNKRANMNSAMSNDAAMKQAYAQKAAQMGAPIGALNGASMPQMPTIFDLLTHITERAHELNSRARSVADVAFGNRPSSNDAEQVAHDCSSIFGQLLNIRSILGDVNEELRRFDGRV